MIFCRPRPKLSSYHINELILFSGAYRYFKNKKTARRMVYGFTNGETFQPTPLFVEGVDFIRRKDGSPIYTESAVTKLKNYIKERNEKKMANS